MKTLLFNWYNKTTKSRLCATSVVNEKVAQSIASDYGVSIDNLIIEPEVLNWNILPISEYSNSTFGSTIMGS